MAAIISHAQRAASSAGKQIQSIANRVFPPPQREQKLKEAHAFANRNPKLASFLAVQIALTGIPLFLFVIFAISTLLISLSTCLLFAITTAFTYTLFAVGIALFFLIPTLFIASCAASCFFLWGLSAYILLRRFGRGEAPVEPDTRVGDKPHGLTSGSLDWMADKETQGRKEVNRNGEKSPKPTDIAALKDGQGLVNGDEWDKKWDQGTQQRQKEFAENLGIKIEVVTPPLSS